MEQKSQDQYLAWMMRYHVQWAPGFRCGSKSAVRMTGPTSSVPTSGREFDSCRRKHGNCNGECLQQHVCFAERKDRWMDRPTHRQLYVVPGSPDIVEFSGCRQLNIVMPLWSQICQVKSHQRLIFGVQDTQHADNFATLSHDMNMSKPKIWVMCDTKLSIFEVIAKFFWPTNKCPHVVYLKKSQANVLKTGCLVLVPCLATCQEGLKMLRSHPAQIRCF